MEVPGTSNLVNNNQTDTIVYIPLVLPNQSVVNGYIRAEISDSISISHAVANEYDNYSFGNGAINSAENFVSRIMYLDKQVFGQREFKVIDKRLFNDPLYTDTAHETRKVRIDTGTVNSLFALICYPQTIISIRANMHCTRSGPCTATSCDFCSMCVDYYLVNSTTQNCQNEEMGGGGGGGTPWNPGPVGGGGTGGVGLVPMPLEDDPSLTQPIDTLLKMYSRAIKDTAIFIYDNLSKPANVEYAFTGIWYNDKIKVVEKTTNNDSLIVLPKVMIGNLIILFVWHSHVSKSLDSTNRGSFSPADIDMLRNVRCLKKNFISFADCRNKRYALVINDVAKATAFFANNDVEDIWDKHSPTSGATVQEKDESSVKNVIGSAAVSGISFYVSNDSPLFQTWTLLNP